MKLSLNFHGMYLHYELYLINDSLSNASLKQKILLNFPYKHFKICVRTRHLICFMEVFMLKASKHELLSKSALSGEWKHLNPFLPNTPFLYPLKTSENRMVFWCFQGVEKRCIGNEWVNYKAMDRNF